MLGFIKNIYKISLIAVLVPGLAFGAQQQNPRGASGARDAARSADSESSASIRRSATSVIARSAVANKRQARTVVTARPATVRVAAVRSTRPVVKGVNVARAAAKPSLVRSGAKIKSGDVNLSRAGTARATAVFNDVSKIGGGYSNCRDSYSTCMDQMCANANDTYRRCFCSDRFMGFRDTSDKIDQALKLLAEFQNVNLDAVNKTAAEVNAMYTATEGEAAIKRDTSASQKLLDNISDILAGKKTTYVSKKVSAPTTTSLGVLDFSAFSSGGGDVFGDSSSVFGSGSSSSLGGFGASSSYTDISSLEGDDLYNGAMQQCAQITRESCGGDAMFNLARSSYSILITQDCNAYEKSINAKKASLEDTIRTAEKYLREARLNEYHAHNSADVSECLSAVEAAIRQPNACGANYERCLDYSGLYINPSTGEPVYSQALFKMNDLIVLNGGADVAGANPEFNKFLDDKKIFVESALDTCRGIADTVWAEFKRMAIIQIAQAQDDKIEQIKSSCVETMKECYDTQTDSLVSLSEDVSKSATGAISTIAARDMCKDKVFACAALYGDVDGCVYDDKTKKLSQNGTKKCGLQSLLALVDAVDSVKFSKGCEESLREFAKETCAPTSNDGEHTYPWGCRLRSPQWLQEQLNNRAATFCASDFESDYTISSTNRLNTNYAETVNKIMDEVREDMATMLADECWNITTEGSLIWDRSGFSIKDTNTDVVNVSPAWLEKVYGGRGLGSLQEAGVSGYTLKIERYGSSLTVSGSKAFGWGVCMIPSVEQLCSVQNQLPGMENAAEYKGTTCELKDSWFVAKCESIGGYFQAGQCYIK